MRSSLSCEANAVALRTHASFAPPLRLSGEPPDSRRGGAVTFNLSRRAGCEGARESRGSHAARLERGVGTGSCAESCTPTLGLWRAGNVTRCRETVTYTCVPYVYNWSQDVEKCTLDLVLSSSTRTNTVQATAVASKLRRKSLQDPLAVYNTLLKHSSTALSNARVYKLCR